VGRLRAGTTGSTVQNSLKLEIFKSKNSVNLCALAHSDYSSLSSYTVLTIFQNIALNHVLYHTISFPFLLFPSHGHEWQKSAKTQSTVVISYYYMARFFRIEQKKRVQKAINQSIVPLLVESDIYSHSIHFQDYTIPPH
jgi:hypothetical protein